jgi:hypothetical protein
LDDSFASLVRSLGFLEEQKAAKFNWRVKDANLGLSSTQLVSPAHRQKRRKCQFDEQVNKWASMQAGYTKVYSFCSPAYMFSTINIFLPFLWKRGIAINYFLPLANSCTQVSCQWSLTNSALSPHYILPSQTWS